MGTNNQIDVTSKNLGKLSAFLQREIERPSLTAQIPDKAHIFHGAYNDNDLTQANLKLAANTLLGMMLGYVEEAPLVMVFEYNADKETVVDLASASHKRKARTVIQSFREQSQRELKTKINKLATSP
ncbi:MAG TPA: hypothetical protein ENK32_05015 [Anaerolineae bacterium]|nr:hypothetical protein [Anaerolineae bacterium]